jgi:bacteriocin-like protein
MKDEILDEANGPVRELTIEELDSVSGGGLWHWLKTHFHKDKQNVQWG